MSSYPIDDADDFSLFSSVLGAKPQPDEDEDDDDAIRDTMFLLLRLYYGKANNQKRSLEEELELLKQSSQFDRDVNKPELPADDTWRLDALSPSGSRNRGPLLDSSGRVR